MLDKMLLCKSYQFLFVSGLPLIWMVLKAKSQDDIPANYRFTTCGSRDREGPTYMECTEHYCNSGSLVCGHLLNEGTRGSQIFVVPRSGNYTVTIAGASGGHGVCSNYSGLGVIARETVQFRRGEILRILVGQQGISACDGHQDVDICQISNDTEACEDLWAYNITTNQLFLLDGGGGGGGATVISNARFSELDPPIVTAPGGGGAGAIYYPTAFLTALMFNVSSNVEAMYINYTYGHAFETYSELANGITGRQFFVSSSAGVGAGYFNRFLFPPRAGDPDPLVREAFGGVDCDESVRPERVLFPGTHGGFGGGGGGCSGGGSGAGYSGGSIVVFGPGTSGEGGYSWPDPPWPFIGYNDGDGYVKLFHESCGCTYNCIIYNQSSFECSCPSNALLALNGFDCYTEENYLLENENTSIVLSYPPYEEVITHIAYLNTTIFSYGIAGAFSDQTSSNSCAVLFANNRGKLIATTKFINRSSDDDFLSFELFHATTMVNISSSPTVMSVMLSMNSELMLEEPLSVASVITFGIEGDCILDELIVNASIDDIYEPEPEPTELLDLTSSEVLRAYFFALNNITSNTTDIPSTNATNTTDIPSTITDTSGELSAGTIAGIIISIVVVLIVLMIISVAIIYFYGCSSKCKISIMKYNEEEEKKTKDLQSDCVIISHQSLYIEQPDHQYEKLSPGYENLPDIELTTIDRRGSTLKYGFKAPLQDYYKFNCSRQIDDWSYDRAQLIYMREIGEGQFGKVLLMKAKDICGVKGSVLVAVKTLTSRDPKDIQRFSEEMGLMKKFIHPNIVSLLGHCEATSDGAPMMILELMQHGDLKWFLQSNRPSEEESSVITDSVAINIVIDVATALEYLTENKYVHRDVAARNCLIGEGFKAKLSDFGLARGVHEKDYYKVAARTALPVRWMAPESLLYGKFSSASDVWSYGVLVWEVATYGEPPHEQLQVRDLIDHASNGSLQLDRPIGCAELLADVISQCTAIQSEDRPTFTEILEYYKQKQYANTDTEQSVKM